MTRRRTILVGDAEEQLRTLAPASIDCVITSPPYYALRDYGVPGQIGLEANVDAWVDKLVAVFDQVARVLKPTGALWLNVADSYSRHPSLGAPTKGLLLAPEKLLFALTSRGWLLRNRVIWAKPNPMPTSVRDRLNASHDFIYLLVRSPWYFFDLDAIREPHRSMRRPTARKDESTHPTWVGPLAGTRKGLDRLHAAGVSGHVLGKNPGDVWSIATRSFRGDHFATFPEELVRRPLLATCPEAVCTACGEPWRRKSATRQLGTTAPTPDGKRLRRYPRRWVSVHERGPLMPCGCGVPSRPGVVLDPFFGTGTVGAVAERFGRDWVGIELNPTYAAMAEKRIAQARAPAESRRQQRQAA
jgi:DNA modification methylase